MRLQVQLHGMGVELSHLRGFAHQPVQPVALLVDDGEQLLARCFVEFGVAEERLCGSFDGGKRGAKVVGDRIEQNGAEALAFASGLGMRQLFHRPGTFNGDGDQAADRLHALGGKSPPITARAPTERSPMRRGRMRRCLAGSLTGSPRLLTRCRSSLEIKLLRAQVGVVHLLAVDGKHPGVMAPKISTTLTGIALTRPSTLSAVSICWLKA